MTHNTLSRYCLRLVFRQIHWFSFYLTSKSLSFIDDNDNYDDFFVLVDVSLSFVVSSIIVEVVVSVVVDVVDVIEVDVVVVVVVVVTVVVVNFLPDVVILILPLLIDEVEKSKSNGGGL